MDKDRIIGSAKIIEGKLIEGVGQVIGDAKLASKGTVKTAEGKIQNAVGATKDAIRDA